MKAGYVVVVGNLALNLAERANRLPDVLSAVSTEMDNYNTSILAVAVASLTCVLSAGYYLNREERKARKAEKLKTPSILQWRDANPTVS